MTDNNKENIKVAERNASSAYKKFRTKEESNNELVENADIKKHLDEGLMFLH